MTRLALYACGILFALALQSCTPIVYCRDLPDQSHRCDVAVRIPTELPR